MRKGLGYNWTDSKTNTEILNELKIASVIQKTNVLVYKSNRTNHVNRIPQ
jgi:hypothetical protein